MTYPSYPYMDPYYPGSYSPLSENLTQSSLEALIHEKQIRDTLGGSRYPSIDELSTLAVPSPQRVPIPQQRLPIQNYRYLQEPSRITRSPSGQVSPSRLPINMSGPTVKPLSATGMPAWSLEGGGDRSGWRAPTYPSPESRPGWIGGPSGPLSKSPPIGAVNQYGVPPSVPWYSPDVTSSEVGPVGPEMMPGASPGGGPGFYDWITDKGSWDPELTTTEAYGMNIAASLIPTHDQTRVFEGGGSLPGIGKGALIGGSVGAWPGAIIGGTLGLLGAFDTTSPPERSETTWSRGASPGFPNVPTASYFQGLI